MPCSEFNLQPGASQQPSYLLATITLTLIAWDTEGMGFMLFASSEVWIDIFPKNIFHEDSLVHGGEACIPSVKRDQCTE